MENAYQFRDRLTTVHASARRDQRVVPLADDVVLGDGSTIVISEMADELVQRVAEDLQDFLLTGMRISVSVERVAHFGVEALKASTGSKVVLGTARELPELAGDLRVPRGYRVRCEDGVVLVCGSDPRGAAQGSYYLEDVMSLRRAPFLGHCDEVRTPIFSPRMVHSAWALDEYPDGYLNAIAHAGMDSLLVFAVAPDLTPDGRTRKSRGSGGGPVGRPNDFNLLVQRAEQYGLDVYLYYYGADHSLPHPADPGAEEAYERMFGELFRRCPGARGLVLVGESAEFPSRDPATTGRPRNEPRAPHDLRPTPGWWPCSDYPDFVRLITRVVRKHQPDADVVFWTYNWGYAPEKPRLELIRSLPSDISLQVTFEMFEPLPHDNVVNMAVDYTIALPGPGAYFRSEAQVAAERGLPLYAMANTAGRTWDVGVVPYVPVPQQWMRRHTQLSAAHDQWGLSGLMEGHHYGWTPSVVSELAKWAYWSPTRPAAELLREIAARDFGESAAEQVVNAWSAWSDAINDYPPANEDQYGPFRIGPAYPLVFERMPVLQVDDDVLFGAAIFFLDYRPRISQRAPQSPGPIRIRAEIASLERMERRWRAGVETLRAALASVPVASRTDAERELGVGRFFLTAVHTTLNVKRWWLTKLELMLEGDPDRAIQLVDQLVVLAQEEVANAKQALTLTENDSRLGWEPSMGYVGGPEQIRWKIRHVEAVIAEELPHYRASLEREATR